MKESILVVGANGQIGTELVESLRTLHGESSVIATDLKEAHSSLQGNGPFYKVDVLDSKAIAEIISKNNVKQVYLLAALLSATAEQKVKSAWRLNMEGLLGTLDLAREYGFKLFWPSSIAVFGPTTPRVNTPQCTVAEPNTVYGISKLAGERWCEYYHQKFGVDVRSLRYPGLIGWKSEPGGGTTDYAVHIFHEALRTKTYTSFLGKDTRLPMMYMPDAIRATLGIMYAEAGGVRIRSSYNVAAISFTPHEIASEIRKHIVDFKMDYAPDSRQEIADSWPESIDDTAARTDWGWKHEYDLSRMTDDMLLHLQQPVAG